MKKTLALLAALSLIISANTALAFSDLGENNAYYNTLTYLNWEGVIQGYPDGTVKPNNTVNRAELMKILVEGQNLLEGLDTSGYNNCFPDVTGDWFAVYVCYAAEKGWVEGYPDGSFKPAQTVNRAEAIKMIMEAFNIDTRTPQTTLYNDVNVDDWFLPYLQTARDRNFLEETGNTFSPLSSRTRAEVSEIVARIMQINYMGDEVYNDIIKAEFDTFILLDKLRKENGVNEHLILHPVLTGTARAHSQDMAEVIGNMSHEGSDGLQSFDRIKAAMGEGFPGRTGENVGRGTGAIFQAILNVHNNVFMPEPDDVCNHRTTILSTCLPFTHVGIGIYKKGDYTYFTQDFATMEYTDVLL